MQLRIGQVLPDWSVERWFHHEGELQLPDLRGRVVVIEAFQMLCPGCVSHGLPLAQRIRETFEEKDVAVIGLHTVFEHHDAMPPHALEVFLNEYRIRFPVGVDLSGSESMPETMSRYGLRGTPSLLLVDREGRLGAHHFGAVSDLQIGAEIGSLLGNAIAGNSKTTDSSAQACALDDCT